MSKLGKIASIGVSIISAASNVVATPSNIDSKIDPTTLGTQVLNKEAANAMNTGSKKTSVRKTSKNEQTSKKKK